MENRRLAAFGGLVGAASLSSVAAQEEVGVSINATESDDDAEGEDDGTEASGVDLSGLGDEIESTVTTAVGADDDDGEDDEAEEGTEGVSADTTLTLDNTPGTAISDASGGDDNFAFVS